MGLFQRELRALPLPALRAPLVPEPRGFFCSPLGAHAPLSLAGSKPSRSLLPALAAGLLEVAWGFLRCLGCGLEKSSCAAGSVCPLAWLSRGVNPASSQGHC
jgi:hypothetical protein